MKTSSGYAAPRAHGEFVALQYIIVRRKINPRHRDLRAVNATARSQEKTARPFVTSGTDAYIKSSLVIGHINLMTRAGANRQA
jgi:hypothetical protein